MQLGNENQILEFTLKMDTDAYNSKIYFYYSFTMKTNFKRVFLSAAGNV